MQSGPLCPSCFEPGHPVGRDAKHRALFRCVSPRCDVIEYDRQLIRSREGAALNLAEREGRNATRGPAYWTRRAAFR